MVVFFSFVWCSSLFGGSAAVLTRTVMCRLDGSRTTRTIFSFSFSSSAQLFLSLSSLAVDALLFPFSSSLSLSQWSLHYSCTSYSSSSSAQSNLVQHHFWLLFNSQLAISSLEFCSILFVFKLVLAENCGLPQLMSRKVFDIPLSLSCSLFWLLVCSASASTYSLCSLPCKHHL